MSKLVDKNALTSLALGLDARAKKAVNDEKLRAIKIEESLSNDIQSLSDTVSNLEYEDLLNKPEIPSKTSQLENDSNFTKIYVGTLAEYEVANAKKLIPIGAIVIITDDDDEVNTDIMAGIAKLGHAKLGELILGKGV